MSRKAGSERFLKGFTSPDELRSRKVRVFAAGTILGICLGLFGVWTYHVAGASSFCGSCHSMADVYKGWQASRHKQFGCVDCHMPVGNVVTRVGYKAFAGMRDLYHETVRDYGAQSNPSAQARNILNANCLRCHFSTVEATSLARGGGNCTKCHVGLVHRRGIEKGGLNIEIKN
jgi:cytochrome c nitrite reductase small subunit